MFDTLRHRKLEGQQRIIQSNNLEVAPDTNKGEDMRQAALDALWKINFSALDSTLWNVEVLEHDTFYYGDIMLNPRPLPPHIAIYEDEESKDWPELEQADMTIRTVRNEKIYIFIV